MNVANIQSTETQDRERSALSCELTVLGTNQMVTCQLFPSLWTLNPPLGSMPFFSLLNPHELNLMFWFQREELKIYAQPIILIESKEVPFRNYKK